MQKKTVQILSIALFALFLLWGGGSLIYYVGVPVHGMVLLGGNEQSITEVCGSASIFCRGFYSFLPMLQHTLTRAAVFLPYFLVSLTAYGIFLGIRFARQGKLPTSITLRPWHLLLLFTAALWMIFTSIAYDGAGGDFPIRRIIEPTPAVYQGLDAEGMAELTANFQGLQGRNCLTYVAHTNNGAGVYDIAFSCMQTSFFTRVLPVVLFIVLLLFELLVLGRFLLQRLRITFPLLLLETLFSATAGACALVAILWFLAVLSLFMDLVGWIVVILVPILFYRHTKVWVQRFLFSSWEVPFRWHSVSVILGWLLLSYIALNFLNVVRPFPIGWDDLSSYLNRPRLLVSYGHFVFSMAPFQWEYLTALGFLLFGYESSFGATASMMINWMAGLFALTAVFAFARTYLGKGHGLLSALLYYTLPLVGHFSYADMKVDNAVFTMGVMSLFAVFLFLFPPADEDSEEQERSLRWLALAGVFGGFALSMKATAIMMVAAAVTILLGAGLHWSAFIGAVASVLFVFTAKDVLDVKKIVNHLVGYAFESSRMVFLVLAALVAGGAFAYAFFKDRRRFSAILLGTGFFLGAFLLSISPWIIHNNYLQGSLIPRLEMGAPNTLSPTFVISGGRESAADFGQDIRVLPPELALDNNHPTCTPTGSREELDRYWGFGKGWKHYLTLPWRTVMNLDSTGYYVTTMPALLLFPLLLLLPYFWIKRGRWLRWLGAGTVLIILQWMFMANGIPWYGIGMFFGLCVALEALVARAPDLPNKILASFLIVCSLFVTFGNRFWQYEQQRNLFEYALGKITASALRERTIPYYDDISAVAVQRHNEMPDRPYMYRVGTFIPYFIPKNLEIIGLADHQLDTFNCLFQERDAELTLKRMKAFGINSIVFDTNTATIERDVNGTLHQKVQAFANFLNTASLGLQIVANDPDGGVVYVLIP
ncbi:hypothetical protein A3D88_01365 [Candidatus Peribacteria bacterium RIFCSPHIGHO2_02_FULL_52_16]|nr:MAG: hypothetical protein A2706_03605 [Candidatus Peribacteria bacterium RIFCSPHIGHO2_01_FULL_51_35]OGJ60968.1 MAG: hypothetical protein A3D88_01365 [Candidatus Peribacteria bacterium RIFCSPHIGHO2_02_FULL_52_16]